MSEKESILRKGIDQGLSLDDIQLLEQCLSPDERVRLTHWMRWDWSHHAFKLELLDIGEDDVIDAILD